MKTELIIGPAILKSAGDLCVYLTGRLGRYPAFWTFDRAEAEAFVALGNSNGSIPGMSNLQALESFWQSRQFDKLDNILQEMEAHVIKKQSSLDTSGPEFQARQQS